MFADGTAKMTKRSLVCVPIEQDVSDQSSSTSSSTDSSDAELVAGPAAARTGVASAKVTKAKAVRRTIRKRRTAKPKTNALLNIIYGWSSVHYTYGRTERRKGGIKKHRVSFNPLSMTFVQGGEGVEPYMLAAKATRAYADEHHPVVASRLGQVCGACSDFTGGCQAAYREHHGASHCDRYVEDDGVWVPAAPCLLKGCVEHALANLVGPGGTGWGKIKEHPAISKQQVRMCVRRFVMCGIIPMDLFLLFNMD